MRTLLKQLLETSLVGSGSARLGRWFMRRRALVLAFHNVVPDDTPAVGEASLHLRLGRFCRFLDLLSRQVEVVPLASLLEPSRAVDRPRVAITFDDAYRGAVTLAVPELARRGLPATLFVAPGLLGGHTFWWDAFSAVIDPSSFEDFRSRALDEHRGQDAAIRAWGRQAGIEPESMPPWAQSASAEELRDAAAHPRISLGSHSWSHPNLARLTERETADELSRSLEWLRTNCDAVIPWLTYPYGLASPTTFRVAEEVGYMGAALISGGWSDLPTRRPLAIPRLNVPAALSLRGLALRTAGL